MCVWNENTQFAHVMCATINLLTVQCALMILVGCNSKCQRTNNGIASKISADEYIAHFGKYANLVNVHALSMSRMKIDLTQY